MAIAFDSVWNSLSPCWLDARKSKMLDRCTSSQLLIANKINCFSVLFHKPHRKLLVLRFFPIITNLNIVVTCVCSHVSCLIVLSQTLNGIECWGVVAGGRRSSSQPGECSINGGSNNWFWRTCFVQCFWWSSRMHFLVNGLGQFASTVQPARIKPQPEHACTQRPNISKKLSSFLLVPKSRAECRTHRLQLASKVCNLAAKILWRCR
jgi:hypothetical protein